SSVLAGTVVLRLKEASAGLAKPETPSEAVQAMLTSPGCQAPSALPQLTVGFFLSTLLPEMGPAVVELLTASATTWLPVETLASSVLAGRLVDRLKEASAG